MPDFLLIAHEDEAVHAAEAPAAIAELLAARGRFEAELRRAGVLRAAGRFRPAHAGVRARRSAAGIALGSAAAQRGEQSAAGYQWIGAASLDEAAALALAVPTLASDEIEVRPLMKGTAPGALGDLPGKIVGCLVLGAGAREADWVGVMDRIDAESTRGSYQARFLGGLRLEPPSRGRLAATRGGHRALFDGPFLESKEIVGGLFFVRVARLEDAVEWAGTTPFVDHGTLELRELWRT